MPLTPDSRTVTIGTGPCGRVTSVGAAAGFIWDLGGHVVFGSIGYAVEMGISSPRRLVAAGPGARWEP